VPFELGGGPLGELVVGGNVAEGWGVGSGW
jgi:hypothetical protein